jgi:hypothetical protein
LQEDALYHGSERASAFLKSLIGQILGKKTDYPVQGLQICWLRTGNILKLYIISMSCQVICFRLPTEAIA